MRRNIIIGISFVFLLMIAAVYFFFFGGYDRLFKKTSTQPPANTVAPQNQGKGQLLALSEKKVTSPALSLTQSSVWYFDSSGQLYRNKFDASDEQSFGLSDVMPIRRAYWPASGNDFIIELSAAGTSTAYRYYSADSKQFVSLKPSIQSLEWLPDGKRMVYSWLTAEGKYELKMSNADGSGFSKISDLSAAYLVKASPKDNFVVLFKAFVANAASKVYSVQLDTGVATEIIGTGNNTGVAFSPDGKKLLFARVNEGNSLPELWLYDFASKSSKNTNLATSVDKTVWAKSSDKFYYGAPEKIADGDSAVAQATSDSLHVYDLAGSKQTEILPKNSSSPVDFRDMSVTDDEKILVFRNGKDGKLYEKNLK